MFSRIYTDQTRKLLKLFPVVAVIGARQTGKTTLCRHLLNVDRDYFNLDDYDTLNLAKKNADSILLRPKPVTIDEVQRSPELLLRIKRIVDQQKDPGRFLITGSANIEFLPRLQESLAGRVAFVEMFPVTLFEQFSKSKEPGIVRLLSNGNINALDAQPGPLINLLQETLNGSYPDLTLNKDEFYRDNWYNGYIKTYLERDVRDIQTIQNLANFQRTLTLAHSRIGTIMDKTSLARDIGLDNKTFNTYLNLLYISYQLFELTPYFANIGKRFIKSPKLYAFDPGLAAYLQGIENVLDAEKFNKTGALLENKMVVDIKALLSVYLPKARLFFYKTHGGGEIDLIIQHKNALYPIEIKSMSGAKVKTKTMTNFLQNFPQAPFGVVIYNGEHVVQAHDRIYMVPWNRLLL
ncbi:MAG: ATP-binding protein [Calditrichaeota bacterium]|nr:ATP-binding protein [Calditrichota bacterium]